MEAGEMPVIGQEVDTLLSSMHRAVTELHESIESTRRSDGSSHIVDFEQFESRARKISELRAIHTELQKITSMVAQCGMKAETLHEDELQALQGYIASATKGRPRRGEPWKDKERTARVLMSDPKSDPKTDSKTGPKSDSKTGPKTDPKSDIEWVSAAPVAELGAPGPSRCRIELAEQVSLDAVIVPDSLEGSREILAAVGTSELYYIPQWDHFAVRVGAVVFHGNIGQVYSGGSRSAQKTPKRVKECRHHSDCPSLRGGARCSYYHDPAEGHSRDIRNFIADSWVYVSATSRHAARYGSRRIGSREALASDLQSITHVDARRFLAQTAHDILCSIILAKYVLPP